MFEIRELSRKSSRLEDRWIKKSNYKAIIKPNIAEIWTKACFRCGFWGSSMDLIDCEQCHRFFVHRQCKLSQENGSPESEWTCKSCMDKKRMQINYQSSPIKKTSRMRSGWLPSQKLSDKQLLLGYKDRISKNECGIRLSEHHERPANKLIKVEPPSLQMENNRKQKLAIDRPDTFDDDDYSATKANGGFRDAQYKHQKVLFGNDKSSDKKWDSFRGKASSKLIKTRAENLQLTPYKRDGSNHVENMPRKRTIDNSDILSNDDRRVSPVSFKARKGLFQVGPYRPLRVGPRNDTSSDKNWMSDHGRASKKLMHDENMLRRKPIPKYSEFCGEEDAGVDHAATKSNKRLSQAVRDWPQNFRHENDSTPVKKRDITEQSVELMDQSGNGAQPDVTGIKSDHVERRHEYAPAEPKKNPVWKGLARVKLGNYRADMELCCYPSTKCSSKAVEAVNRLSSMITFAFKYRSTVWPKRFQVSQLTDDAITLYFLPQSEKDVVAYDGLLDQLVKYKFALQYEMSLKNQKLLIFPSLLLPTEFHKLGRKYYMWGYLDEKGR